MSVRPMLIFVAGMTLVAAACGSGPSPDAEARNQVPSTTTTTEPPPEGVVVVKIANAAFRPSNLTLDLTKEWIVKWTNQDDRTYVIESRTRDEFTSPEIPPGGEWEFDFRELEEGLHRYRMFVGNQRVPGLIDTRPEQ
ncbi:MAG: hypothetical protein ACE5E8_10925 [Acidimicrobiia bacterium]